MSTLTIYYLPGTAAMAPHAALEETGAEFEAVLAVRDAERRAVAPPDYVAISPFGRVPALRDGDVALYEAAAIMLHLADRFPEAGLLPPAGMAERAYAYRSLVYLTNTVQATFMWWFYPERAVGDDAGLQAGIREGAGRQLDEMFDWLDGELAGREYLLGAFSGADLYLHMLTRWGRNLPRPAWSLPNVGAHYERMSARPSVARMLAAQGIEAYGEPG